MYSVHGMCEELSEECTLNSSLMEYYLGNFCAAILQKKFPKMYDVFREHNMKITYKKFPKGD